LVAPELSTNIRFQSSAHIVGWQYTGAIILEDTALLLEYPEDGGSKLLSNFAMYVPMYAVSHSRRLESSSAVL
jgi:hypothetical protein